MTPKLDAPFPWFGGKSRVADIVWQRFGQVANYVEPFAGSLAVLLGSPRVHRVETVNDIDGFIANFWRATASDPDAVAQHCDWPVSEADLHSRHAWLVGQRDDLTERLMGDPDFFDAKIAGWWCWGIACWIGSGWCSGNGPWQSVDGKFLKGGDANQGVHRQLPHLGDAGRGVHRKLPHLGDAGREVHGWLSALRDRLRRVRVACGDWRRVCGPSPTHLLGLTAVFLDPPYSAGERCAGLYALDSGTVAASCREWAMSAGDNPKMRIALCGYDDEHEMFGWTKVHWKTHGGYGNQGNSQGKANRHRETIWFSPHCLDPAQGSLF